MIESLKDIKTFLTDNLEAGIAHIETENSITIERWRFLDTYQADNEQFPSVSILPDNTGEQLPGAGNRGSNGIIQRYDNINIIVWDRGNRTNTRKIEDNVIGYMEALNYLFMNNADMDGEYMLLKITGTSYTDLFPDPARQTMNSLLKGGVFALEVRPKYF